MLIGQLDRVRGWNFATDQISAPYDLDMRKSAGLCPVLRPAHGHPEWEKWRDGYYTYEWVLPGIGGAYTMIHPMSTLLPVASSTPTSQTTALNAAYTYNSAGPAVALRLLPLSNFVIDNIYYYISVAANGTQASITDINFELRNNNADTAPNTTLLTSGSANPNGEGTWIGWHKISPTQYTTTAGTTVWAIIADANGGATNYATVQQSLTNTSPYSVSYAGQQMPYNTANGFSTTTVLGTSPGPCFVLENATTGEVWGSSISGYANTASSTNRRGCYMSLLNSLSYRGMLCVSTVAQLSGGEVYDTSTSPGGATLASTTTLIKSSTGSSLGIIHLTPYATVAGVANRFVFTYSSAGTGPTKGSIGADNGYTTPLRAAKPGGVNNYYTEANGTTNWANDDQGAIAQVVWLFGDQFAPVNTPRNRGIISGGKLG